MYFARGFSEVFCAFFFRSLKFERDQCLEGNIGFHRVKGRT